MKYTAQYKKILFAIAVIGLLGLFTHVAKAQEAQRTITIVPPSESLTVNPGDRSEGVLKVINDSSDTLTFTASTQDFIVNDTNGTPDFVSKDTFGKPYSAAAWIGVVPDTFTIAPHQKQILNYYLQVPKDARPGGHYAGVLYTPSSAGANKNTGPAVSTQIGTLFSIDVSGAIHEEATVSKFAPEHGFYEYGPATILTQIKNLGDLHIKPLGTMTITDIFGRKLASIPLDEHNIFPQAARDYVTVFGQHWMVGPFTVKFVATFGRGGNLPLTAITTFWVFPWKVALVILLIIIAAVMGYMVWKRKKNTPSEPIKPATEEAKPTEVPEPPATEK